MTTHTPSIDLDVPAGEPVIRFNRFVAAPPDLVFRMFTEPEHLRRWWGPRYLELVVCDVDLRAGGPFRFVSRAPDGGEHPFSGEFVAVERAAAAVDAGRVRAAARRVVDRRHDVRGGRRRLATSSARRRSPRSTRARGTWPRAWRAACASRTSGSTSSRRC
jgi:hypothetical protein